MHDFFNDRGPALDIRPVLQRAIRRVTTRATVREDALQAAVVGSVFGK
jgi:hypothetical protein